MMGINLEMIFAIGLFATVTLLAYTRSGMVFRNQETPMLNRLKGTPIGDELPADYQPGAQRESWETMKRLSQTAAGPFMPRDSRNENFLRRQLAYAGYYSTGAMQTVVGAKVILLFAVAFGGWLTGSMIGSLSGLIGLMAGACVGYLAPSFWLRLKIRRRMRDFERALPDALDLMVVCVEAGLTLDAAVQRVGHEIAMAHPEIAREFGITHMESRIGVQRMQALRNLGQRTGSAALQSLAAMLVQTERFGTSIAQALRVHAESLRTRRQHKAEEQAAKTTVKLAFPVVLFIFPCLIVVLGGPAIILFFKSPLFTSP